MKNTKKFEHKKDLKKVTVLSPKNVRVSPDATAIITGVAKEGEIEVLEEKENWYRIKQGWITKDYIQK